MIGLRPEAISIGEKGKLNGVISHLEHLGADTNVYVHIDGELVTVRLFGEQNFDIGADISLDFADETMFCFDENGQRVRN